MENNIEPTYCSFEISKLLKEKEFTTGNSTEYVPGYYYEEETKGFIPDLFEMQEEDWDRKDYYLRPQHWQIIQWLRINFGIHICIRVSHVKYNILITNPLGDILFNDSAFNTYEEAESEAILFTLKYLL
jgi:hypothetical protein